MIKFFRKIRLELMENNKTGKYVKYAIGEVILVVIGILIALMINDWNEKRLESIEEVRILESLKKDFLDSRANIENTIEKQNNVVRLSYKLMGITYNRPQEIPMDSVGMYIYAGALSYWRIEPITGTYDALIGSGKTNIIRNQELNRLLAEYSAELKYGFEDEDYSIQLTTLLTEKCSSYSPYFLSYELKEYLKVDIGNYEERQKVAYAEHLDNMSFLGLLKSKTTMEKNRLEYQNKLLEYVNRIIEGIGSELGPYTEKRKANNE